MNDIHVTVTGWVAKTPELRITTDDREWTTLRIGSTPRRRNSEGIWVDGVTQWFEVKAWGRFARNVAKSIRGGNPVVVSGRMFTEEWETADGTRSQQVIHAHTIGHDLTRGQADFVRVKHESGQDGNVVDVTDADELVDDDAPDAGGGSDAAGGAAGVREPEPAF